MAVLESFLVKLGFQVNKDQEAKMLGSIEKVQKGLAVAAHRALGLATVVGVAAFKEMQVLTKEANNLKLFFASGAKVTAMGRAFKALGADVSQATSAISAFVTKAQLNPYGLEYRVKMMTRGAVSVRDKNGQGRDPVDVLMDVIRDKNFLALPDYMKLQHMQGLGIDPGMARMMLNKSFFGEFQKELERQKKLRTNEGDKHAEKTAAVYNELLSTTTILNTAFKSLVGMVVGESGVIDALKRFNDQLSAGLGWFIGSWQSMFELSKDKDGNVQWSKLFKMFFDPYETNRLQVADALARGRKLTPEEQEMLDEFSGLKQWKISGDARKNLEDQGWSDDQIKRLEQTHRANAIKERDSRLKPFLDDVERLRNLYKTPKAAVDAALGAQPPKQAGAGTSGTSQVNGLEKAVERGTEDLARDETIRQLMDRLTSKDYWDTQAGSSQGTGLAQSDKFREAKGFGRNNPGNIRDKSGQFRTFATMEDGFRALGEQIKGYANAGARSVSDIISTYAPAWDKNNTKGYIDKISKALGVRPTDAIDLSNPKTMYTMMRHMAEVELGAGAGRYFSGSSWERQAALASQSTWKSKAYQAANGGNNVTINATYNVRGSMDPAAAKSINEYSRDLILCRGLGKAHAG